MEELRVLIDGLRFGESPRWHDGRLWLAHWVANDLCVLTDDGRMEMVASFPGFPISVDWLPDGNALAVSGREARLLRGGGDGNFIAYRDLQPLLAGGVWNEIVIDGAGNAYVNGGRFDAAPGSAESGVIALVAPQGEPRLVADGLAFPNGIAITADGRTLIVAESHAAQLTAFTIEPDGMLTERRPWARLDGAAPDGICLDTEGACWYADVPNRRCARVAEGGTVLDTVELDRGAFACMLGGSEGTTLFITAAHWPGFDGMHDSPPSGQLLATDAPAAHAGRP